ncbi:GatB/YqeY domain-containing protein [Desulfovibrio mangrovi]|uniref:GatB/YqeY domain-containing protein n=1 Tax=Desulfovibrio mangrovi TaxID=2976983 RepID=UPI0022459242|nr:GatB/YqeY domain-containing protein [Desulfovibrio mangrovi]UZP68386.1 GatB/YqeY domain-containing protein [Desulfovibrio mangrovi]
MSLAKQIEVDYIAAYKAKDQVKLGVLRHLKTATKNLQVEVLRELTDEDVFGVIMKQAKQRQDSIEQYNTANRPDLAAIEAAELDVLKTYLPQPLSDEELAALVDETIAETGAADMKDMGKVMNPIMANYKGRVDGKKLSALVREKLS